MFEICFSFKKTFLKQLLPSFLQSTTIYSLQLPNRCSLWLCHHDCGKLPYSKNKLRYIFDIIGSYFVSTCEGLTNECAVLKTESSISKRKMTNISLCKIQSLNICIVIFNQVVIKNVLCNASSPIFYKKPILKTLSNSPFCKYKDFQFYPKRIQ